MQPVGLRPAATGKKNIEATRQERKKRLIAEAKETLRNAGGALKRGDTVQAGKLRLEAKRIRDMATERPLLPPPGRQLSSDMYQCAEIIVDGMHAPEIDLDTLCEDNYEEAKFYLAGFLLEELLTCFRRAAIRAQVFAWGNLLWHTAERIRRTGHIYEKANLMAFAELQSYAEPLVEHTVQAYALGKAHHDALAAAERLMIARACHASWNPARDLPVPRTAHQQLVDVSDAVGQVEASMWMPSVSGPRQNHESDAMWEARQEGRPFTPLQDGFGSDLVREQLRRAFWIAGSGRGLHDEPERTDFALYAAERTQALLLRPGYKYEQMGTGYGWINAQCFDRRKEWRKTLPPTLESWDAMDEVTRDEHLGSRYHSEAFTSDSQVKAQVAESRERLGEIDKAMSSRRKETWDKFRDRGLQHFAFGQPGEASSLRNLADQLDIPEQTCRDLVKYVRGRHTPVHTGNIVGHTAELAALRSDCSLRSYALVVK